MKTKRNLWPLGIVLTLVVFASGIATLVVIASSQKVELVSENYYEQEIQYQQRLDSLDRARQAGASFAYDNTGKRIIISLASGSAAQPDAPARVQLYRASSADLDQELALVPGPGGMQTADTASLAPGPWKVRASWMVGGREYLLEGSLTNKVGALERSSGR